MKNAARRRHSRRPTGARSVLDCKSGKKLLRFLVLALLVCDSARRLACRLAGRLALTAATVFRALAKVPRLDSSDSFHENISNTRRFLCRASAPRSTRSAGRIYYMINIPCSPPLVKKHRGTSLPSPTRPGHWLRPARTNLIFIHRCKNSIAKFPFIYII